MDEKSFLNLIVPGKRWKNGEIGKIHSSHRSIGPKNEEIVPEKNPLKISR